MVTVFIVVVFTLLFFFYQPCCYSTLPALAMDAVLKQTNVSIQLVSDPNLHLFFEDHLRGMDGTMVQKF